MSGRALKGLLIEIQYRTQMQHAWATAVEVVGYITTSQPKFDRGDTRYLRAMSLASEIMARAHENMNGPFPKESNKDLVKSFLDLEKELNLLNRLRGLNEADPDVSDRKNVILIISPSGDLHTRSYKSGVEALRNLFLLEKEYPNSDIVLVKADALEDVRCAFKNYFSDTKDFVGLVERGCEKLSNVRQLRRRTRRST